MPTTDFPAHVAAEVARLETEIGARTREIDRLRSERDDLSRLLSHLYPLRAAYEDAPSAAAETTADGAWELVVGPDEGPEPTPMAVAVAKLVETVAELAVPDEVDVEDVGRVVTGNASAVEVAPEAEAVAPGRLTYLGAVWTEAEDRRLAAMAAQKLTSKEMADKLGRTVKATQQRLLRLRRMGVEGVKREGYGFKVPAERDALMLRMRDEGKTTGQIAAKLGLTAARVRQRMKEIGAAQDPVVAPEPVAEVAAGPGEDLAGVAVAVLRDPDPAAVEALREIVAAEGPGRIVVAPALDVTFSGPWTPEEDRDLVVGLLGERLLDPVAQRLGRTPTDCLARFDALVPDQSEWGLEAARRAWEAGVPGEVAAVKQAVMAEAVAGRAAANEVAA